MLNTARTLLYALLLLGSIGDAHLVSAAPLVVETDPLSPAEQRLKFHLPPGFEIQLVVADPEIGQPMNINFDAAGRLWVTSTREYPYPVKGEGVEEREPRWGIPGDGPARDRLSVIEGIGADGKPTSVRTFLTGLNIPIGHTPVPGGHIVFGIPDIKLAKDTDGDGTADSVTKLYGRFGNLDTHGMASSFTRWLDGWVYACHGFRNKSTVTGSDGHSFTMESGNSFRFKIDGSRIEQVTWGQVNPFGMTFDPWGNQYTADCHSMPITLLLPGAYYESFGKPHDGLGYGPKMIDHLHGSTGICGLAWYQAEQFPTDYQECVYICNPVNGQVHRDKLKWTGSSPMVDTQPEFITCDDEWFRPVDVKLGPDGAIYVADFYNAVIGHYEVELAHPRRDREKGRIWRIIYKGDKPELPDGPQDLTKLSQDELFERLGHPNIAVRTLATHELVDRNGEGTHARSLEILQSPQADEVLRVHALWVAHRTGGVPSDLLLPLAIPQTPMLSTHIARVIGDMGEWDDKVVATAAAILFYGQNPLGHDALAVVQAMGRNPHSHVTPLLIEKLASLDAQDTHLVHAFKIAIRNSLQTWPQDEQVVQELAEQWELTLDIIVGVKSPEAARLAGTIAQSKPLSPPQRTAALQHCARYAPQSDLELAIKTCQAEGSTLEQQVADLRAMHAGLQLRGGDATQILNGWGESVATRLLTETHNVMPTWTISNSADGPPGDNPFTVEKRKSADGDDQSLFFGSLPKGEQRTGVLTSTRFPAPPEFSFWIAGHNAIPDKPEVLNNVVRLRNPITGDILKQAGPPRNDVAQRVTWDLADLQGQTVAFEITDNDRRDAYAWLAVGRFSIEALTPTTEEGFSPVDSATGIISALRLESQLPQLTAVVSDQLRPLADRRRAAETLLSLRGNSRCLALLPAASDPAVPVEFRNLIWHQVAHPDEEVLGKILTDMWKSATFVGQQQLAEALTSDATGTAVLLDDMEAGRASPALLRLPQIVERVQAHQQPELRSTDRVHALLATLPPNDERLAEVIATRRAWLLDHTGERGGVVPPVPPTTVVPDAGPDLFKKHCGACHQLNQVGNKIGPQLDGIGIRGLDRLLEDILDPNRNVDAAFRTTSILTTDGRILTGLLRKEDSGIITLADTKGVEFTVKESDIDTRNLTNISLMPANLGEQIPEGEFKLLVGYLLEQRKKVE